MENLKIADPPPALDQIQTFEFENILMAADPPKNGIFASEKAISLKKKGQNESILPKTDMKKSYLHKGRLQKLN